MCSVSHERLEWDQWGVVGMAGEQKYGGTEAKSGHCCSTAELIFRKETLAWRATGKNCCHSLKNPFSFQQQEGSGAEADGAFGEAEPEQKQRIVCPGVRVYSRTGGEFLLNPSPWVLSLPINGGGLPPARRSLSRLPRQQCGRLGGDAGHSIPCTGYRGWGPSGPPQK